MTDLRTVTKYGVLRKHQQRAMTVAAEVIAKRRHQKVVVAGVTPGGGKTIMAAIYANELADAGLIDQVLVVVPNDPLRQQMKSGFHDASRNLNRCLIDPSRAPMMFGTPFGNVITYQSLTSEVTAKRQAAKVAKRRTLVIFDECHHLCELKAWERGAALLVESAAHVLCMSGTLWRWDEERIPFINYDEKNVALVDIRYSRAEALREEAVLPVEFRFFDGEALYEHHNVSHKSKLSSAPLKEQNRVLKTCLLQEEYTSKFLLEALNDWDRYRTQYYASQAIVVAHDKKSARRAFNFIRHTYAKYAPVISLSAEANSDRAINDFRSGKHAILVTVRKAYEGLDVKGASHLLYLGDSRSWPFLDQVIARVTRYNPNATLSWDEQRGYVYATDDKRMREYVDNMLDEQAEYYREKERGTGTKAAQGRSSFKPDSANLTEVKFGLDGRCLTAEENIGVRELDKLYPQLRAPLSDRLDIAARMNLIPMAPGVSV